ncbi:GGDEF domain-containing protein, partial [Vibrio parahaemolyticus]|nr:GGDEF domain-containing protein [Vibrio parahaemolyticus]
ADHTLKMCKRKKLKSSVLVFDLNKFKPINDNYGHHEGDYVLKVFAMTLLETFRECDVVGRWGGDEFVVFLTDTESDSVKRILGRFSEKIVKLNQEINKPYRIEYSCGVSHYIYDSPLSIEKRIEEADSEMYKEKRTR